MSEIKPVLVKHTGDLIEKHLIHRTSGQTDTAWSRFMKPVTSAAAA